MKPEKEKELFKIEVSPNIFLIAREVVWKGTEEKIDIRLFNPVNEVKFKIGWTRNGFSLQKEKAIELANLLIEKIKLNKE